MRGGVPIFVAFAPSCFSIEAVHHLYAHQTSQEKLVSGLVIQIISPNTATESLYRLCDEKISWVPTLAGVSY